MSDYANKVEEREREDLRQTRRRQEFVRTLCEYVSCYAIGPTHGDVEQWQARLDELAGQLFDQANP